MINGRLLRQCSGHVRLHTGRITDPGIWVGQAQSQRIESFDTSKSRTHGKDIIFYSNIEDGIFDCNVNFNCLSAFL